MQFHVYGECQDTAVVIATLNQFTMRGVLYEDANDPFGIGVVTVSDEPNDFVGEYRRLLQSDPFATLLPKPQYTMFGRTYSIGYEADLNETLVERPMRHLLHDDWPWAVWYPLRRKGQFKQLPAEEQIAILKEHGSIGMKFGAADAAHDIRLACHGLDEHDNDFVIGVMGAELAPLSMLIETMRATKQTSQYIERLGPFFVGKKVWQSG
jgi:chlorite dismutase